MIFRKLFMVWSVFWFLLVFLLLYPFFVLFIQNEKWHAKAHFLNKLWSFIVFGVTLTPTKVERRFKRDKNRAYIYCPNHVSYLDIPSLVYALNGHFKFVGKASLSKVPLLGYMFRKLYIPLERDSKMSKYKTMKLCSEALDQNISVALFPEGTIPRGNHPYMIPFKDGAFRIAIEKQAPIVPVSIPYNWIIFPDNGKLDVRWHKMTVIIHEPIETVGMTLDNLEELKQKTFNVIQEELLKQNQILTKSEIQG